MKLFLTKVSLFSVLLAAGAFAADFTLGEGIKKRDMGEIQVWNDIVNSRIDSDVIVSGSSRAWVHISPEILDTVLNVNSYNLGIDGYPFNMQYVRFKLFEKYNAKPKLVVQNVDFFTLNRRKEPLNREQFMPYMHEEEIKKELRRMDFSKLQFHIPALKYHSDTHSIFCGLLGLTGLGSHPYGRRYKGYVGQELDWDGTGLNKILSKDSIVYKPAPEIVRLFDSFLEYCRENDIRVILVFTPQYYKATEHTKNGNEIKSIYRSFSEKYDFPFLDYSDDPICRDTAYFYNAMHLNKKGSELFSLKLAGDIKALLQ
jgi:hypothetical protein